MEQPGKGNCNKEHLMGRVGREGFGEINKWSKKEASKGEGKRKVNLVINVPL